MTGSANDFTCDCCHPMTSVEAQSATQSLLSSTRVDGMTATPPLPSDLSSIVDWWRWLSAHRRHSKSCCLHRARGIGVWQTRWAPWLCMTQLGNQHDMATVFVVGVRPARPHQQWLRRLTLMVEQWTCMLATASWISIGCFSCSTRKRSWPSSTSV